MDACENRLRDRLLAERLVYPYQAGWDAHYTGEVFAKDIRVLIPLGRVVSPKRVLEAARQLEVRDDEEFGPWLVFVRRVLSVLVETLPPNKGTQWHSM